MRVTRWMMSDDAKKKSQQGCRRYPISRVGEFAAVDGRGEPLPYILVDAGGCGAVDGVAVDDDFDAAIALAAFRRVIGGDGLRLAKATSRD